MAKSKKPVILVGRVTGDPADLPEGIVYHPGRYPDAPRRVSQEVQVIDDPQQIAWTRRAYKADVEYRYQVALEQVRSGEWVYLEFLDALEQCPQQAATELSRIMKDEAAPAMGRARAAQVLASLGKTEGAQFLVAALDSSSAVLCAAAAEMLGDRKSKIDLTEPAIAKQIIKLLSSPDAEVVKKAIHLCTRRKVPGAEESLRAAIGKGQGPLEELAEALVELATNAESVQAALPHLFRKRQKEYKWSVNYWFRHVFDHADATISQPCRQAMQSYLLTYTDPKDRLGQHWAGDLASVADHTVIPVLEEIVARAKDPVSRAYAIEGLARLQPERALTLVLEQLQGDCHFNMLIRILRNYAVEEDFHRIAVALLPPVRVKERRYPLELEEVRLGRVNK